MVPYLGSLLSDVFMKLFSYVYKKKKKADNFIHTLKNSIAFSFFYKVLTKGYGNVPLSDRSALKTSIFKSTIVFSDIILLSLLFRNARNSQIILLMH